LFAASLATLLLTFTVYQGVGQLPTRFSGSVEGAIPVFDVVVEVQRDDLDGGRVPDAGARVVIGLHSSTTDSSGTARLRIPAGRYSAYVKSSSSGLLPLTLDVLVEKSLSLKVVFRTAKLYPEIVELTSGRDSSRVVMRVTVPEGERLFISYPRIRGITSGGQLFSVPGGPAEAHWNFFQRVSPGDLELIVELDNEISIIDARDTYVPLEEIEWSLNALGR